MASPFLRAVLALLHVIYNIFSTTRRLLQSAVQRFDDFYFGPRDLKGELEYVREARAPMQKSLRHLAVILGQEVVSIKDVVRIARWSHAAGASYVSFYDYSGKLKKNKSALDEALISTCQVKSHIPKVNGYINGLAGKQFPHIMLLDISDGKTGIVRAAQQICEKALANDLKSNDVSLEMMNHHVITEAGVPEPELALYCGDICSLYGFLPWHARVTEFLFYEIVGFQGFWDSHVNQGYCRENYGIIIHGQCPSKSIWATESFSKIITVNCLNIRPTTF